MEGLGEKKYSIRSSRPLPWLGPTKTEASALLWKLKDCFSNTVTPSPSSKDREGSFMEGRKPVLDLKDVPPPPAPLHHTTSHSATQRFSLAALPIPPPPTLPPQLLQESHPQQLGLPPLSQQQEGSSPKVSLCSDCDHCTGGYSTLGGGADVGIGCDIEGALSLYMASSSLGVPSTNNSVRRSGPFGAPSVQFEQNQSCGRRNNALTSLTPYGYTPYLPSSVATSQPVSSHLYASGLLHSLLPHPSSQSNQTSFDTPPAISRPSVCAPLHDSCVAPAGLYPCGVDCRRAQMSTALGEHSTTTVSTSTTTSHLCSNPMHLNVKRTGIVKGAHYCQECLLKSVAHVVPESDKLFPLPQTPPIPICNGCGTSADATMLMASKSLNTIAQKYGSPESGGPENVPPVGVFWDIENCSVPSGRSAAAVVERIRSRFFQGHREAEFICVCDINKESKSVIQELNNCQVTVAHINATAKNAADDKLRQSLRRFAETHTAPATVVLVSSDVNFAAELSDLRHRHGFQVILVHGIQASPALLQHANRHVAFQEITADLPARMANAQTNFSLLYVHNLPVSTDKNHLRAMKLRLRRLSSNCGGKVLGVSHGTAVLRFVNAAAATRACKRMENENVYGHRIRVSFSPRPTGETRPEPKFQFYPHHILLPQSFPIHNPWFLPVPPFSAMPFLPLDKARSPRRPRRATRPVPERPYSPRRGCSEPPHGAPFKALQEMTSVEPKLFLDKGHATSSPHCNGLGSRVEVSNSSPAEDPVFRRESSITRSENESHVEEEEVRGEFQISTPSAFSKLNLQGSFSPLVHPQDSWSSRSASPCLSSRSSPLLAPSRRSSEPFSDGAEVQVGNLDYRMSRRDLQQALHDTFSRYGQVKSVELSPHTDYQLKATVQMVSLQHAISAVSGLHRYKIGGKRIQVSLVTGGSNKSLATFSTEIISILQDAPANCLPLFKFTEIFEKKYSRKLVLGDLYRLPEVVAVREQGGSRLVCLLHNQIRQSPVGSSQSRDGSSSASGSPVVFEELEYHEPICRLHYAQHDFSEADFDPDAFHIPFIVMSVSALASDVNTLLQSHGGTLPLLSFPDCYAANFSPLQLGNETLEGGIPLEHVITCVPSITIVTAQNGFKIIKWLHNKPPAPNSEAWMHRCKSPVGNPQLIQFSREIIDLLKSQPSCIMPISKFIPTYHHHFAKQCRVSDYGFSKLLELLEAVPHVLQILGMGTKRLLTLTHRAQVKRFTQDLLKLLKFQASKQVAIRDFMQAYHWCFSRDWQVVDYGVCDLMDLLKEIPDTTITITHQDTDISDTVISVPKRERTSEEIDRAKQFGKEVVDLLRHQPHCTMLFSKFIPTYHHHFGRQCKLSYYGFTKLMELFEAIPDTLMVLECGEEKVLTLTEVERIKALAAQLVKLLRAQRSSSLPVSQLLTEYSRTFGYGLRLQDYDASSLPALLTKLCHVVKVVDGAEGREVQLINRKSLRLLTSQILALLMSQDEEHVSKGLRIDELSSLYMSVYALLLNPCEYGFLSLSELLKSQPYLVELYFEESIDSESVREERVRLTRLYQIARNIRALLHTYHYHQIFMTEFPGAYHKFTGCSIDPHSFGFNNIDELLSAIPQVVWIKGHTHKRIVVLKNDMKDKARASSSVSNSPRPSDISDPSPRDSPVSSVNSDSYCSGGVVPSELLSVASPVDLLCGPVPSCLPSPQLHPDPVLQSHLMNFEQEPPATEGSDLDAAADGRSNFPECQHNDVLPSKIVHSPRRAARSRFKLAANFSFTAGL